MQYICFLFKSRTVRVMAKWTGADIKTLQGNGLKVVGMEGYKAPEPAGKLHIESVLNEFGLKFEKEKKIDKKRKFRSDYYVPDLNLLIEYEGIFSDISRHTFYEGYTTDCDKYNLVSINGYKLLRYTALNFASLKGNLEALIKNNNK